MSVSESLERAALEKIIDGIIKYVNTNKKGEKTYEEKVNSLLKVIELVRKFDDGHIFKPETFDNVIKGIKEPENRKWVDFVIKLFEEVHPNVLKMTALNLGFQSSLMGTRKIRKMREIHGCNIPWVMLIDPTSACNLRCKGCWAAEYGHNLSLTYEELEDIVAQGREIGVYFYMFTGGEPLIRKDDIIKLCDKYRDSEFHAFTNATLIDDAFCEEMVRVGNLTLSISLEGFRTMNDARRGSGDFNNVMHSMDLLKKYGLIFGTSICYTSANVYEVTSDEFVDFLIEKGCRYSWYFHYMPVGADAITDLLPTPEQREYMYRRIREIRGWQEGKPIFVMDFQNDGEYVGGCIAGGRNYLHINSNGDIEPCVFIHYSDSNIREVSLLEALKRPLFMAYRDGQPFNSNHLRPCPMLENPDIIQAIVNKTGARSTDLMKPENVSDLCGKCVEYAMEWSPTADEIWKGNKHHKQTYINYKKGNEKGLEADLDLRTDQ